MILALDIGNTNIKTGLFKGDEMVAYLRLSTDRAKTSDEYGILIVEYLRIKGVTPQEIEAIIGSSVVPTVNFTIEHMCDTYFNHDIMWVGPGMKTGINILYDNPREVGTDRICSCVAAQSFYGGPCIIIDFGTATTFNAVSENGEFMGGAIMPGLKLSAEALVQNTAKLPRFEIVVTEKVINRTTTTNLQAGLYYGYIGAVDNIIRRMKKEMGGHPRIIATGGLSKLIASQSETIEIINGQLTLEGLRLIYNKNKVAQQ